MSDKSPKQFRDESESRRTLPETPPSILQQGPVQFQSSHTGRHNEDILMIKPVNSKTVQRNCTEGDWTYFNDFQGSWIKPFALFHDFTMDCFVNLIPYELKAHHVVLNFYS